jgi:hypothetical protein
VLGDLDGCQGLLSLSGPRLTSDEVLGELIDVVTAVLAGPPSQLVRLGGNSFQHPSGDSSDGGGGHLDGRLIVDRSRRISARSCTSATRNPHTYGSIGAVFWLV